MRMNKTHQPCKLTSCQFNIMGGFCDILDSPIKECKRVQKYYPLLGYKLEE